MHRDPSVPRPATPADAPITSTRPARPAAEGTAVHRHLTSVNTAGSAATRESRPVRMGTRTAVRYALRRAA